MGDKWMLVAMQTTSHRGVPSFINRSSADLPQEAVACAAARLARPSGGEAQRLARAQRPASLLKESAWVLEDAGYTVSVPAWWTLEGRRRAKLRLKTAQRPTKGETGAGSGRLGFESIVAYQYGLSIGDQVVGGAVSRAWRTLRRPGGGASRRAGSEAQGGRNTQMGSR